MSSLDEKITRAQAAQATRPIHKDVTVSLDSALSDERAALLTEVGRLHTERKAREEKADETLGLVADTSDLDKRLNQIASKLKKIDNLERDTLITIRSYRASGGDWMELKAACPPRLNSAIDRGAGFNVNTLTIAACTKYGRVLDGDKELERSLEEWTVLLELLSGGEFERVVNLVYQVNVADALNRTETLKNYSEAALASEKK